MRYISISRFASSLTFLGAAVAASASQFVLMTHQSLKIPQRWTWSMDQIDMIMTTIITLRYHFKICHAYINFVPFWAQCHSFDVASKPDNFAKMTNGSDQCGLEHDDNLSLDSKDYQKELSCVDVGNVGLQICSYICNPTSIHLTALQSLKIQNSSNSNKIGSCCCEVWHQSRIWHLFRRMALSFFGQQITWFFDKMIFFFSC